MATDRYPRLYHKIEAALQDRTKSDLLRGCMKRGRDTRAAALEALPGGASFRDDVRAAKERCIEDLPRLKQQFIERARQRGAIVHEAATGAEAIAYCLDLARRRGARTIAKSKSLTTEEIDLNHPLIEAGVEVVETDLGELIIQLAGEKPFHLVFPSIHKMAPDVAEIFSRVTGTEVPNDIPAIMKVVRQYLRPIFLNADIGLTGANVGIAETGGICIETNEGNARLVSSLGSCHICLIGMEKIVETVEDALLMILAHPVSASGQLPTNYVTWMHGRSPLGEGPTGDDRESHIIILDNGRSAMRDDPEMREALYCIRCGACMNICPTYGVVGGHTFGHIYPGPMGICWTAGVHGLEVAGDFAQLCISCGLCKEICPAQINMPQMIAEIKHRDAAATGHLLVNRVMMGADRAARLGSATAPLANLALASRPIRQLLEKTIGLAAERRLPPFAFSTFMNRFAKRVSRVATPRRTVVFFVDVYANHNNPDLGLAAVDALEALGCAVIVPNQDVSGYPYIAYGGMDQARRIARSNSDKLAPWVRKGYEVVAIEPTATYALAVSYPNLLRGDENARLLADHTHELFEFLIEQEDETGFHPPADLFAGRRFGFHCACHQRPLGGGSGAIKWLRRRGAQVELIETGTCCGMGGTFGLKGGLLGYDLSRAVGQPLFDLFVNSGVEAIVTESSVCSIQLAEGTAMKVYHPLELLTLR
ncbi:MAG: LUD domain-containing protein [Desulfofustis sp.]|jgi:iron-sulfur cluster protein|nr:LUD domain-containing protein [Desulfofustis sp.]